MFFHRFHPMIIIMRFFHLTQIERNLWNLVEFPLVLVECLTLCNVIWFVYTRLYTYEIFINNFKVFFLITFKITSSLCAALFSYYIIIFYCMSPIFFLFWCSNKNSKILKKNIDHVLILFNEIFILIYYYRELMKYKIKVYNSII